MSPPASPSEAAANDQQRQTCVLLEGDIGIPPTRRVSWVFAEVLRLDREMVVAEALDLLRSNPVRFGLVGVRGGQSDRKRSSVGAPFSGYCAFNLLRLARGRPRRWLI